MTCTHEPRPHASNPSLHSFPRGQHSSMTSIGAGQFCLCLNFMKVESHIMLSCFCSTLCLWHSSTCLCVVGSWGSFSLMCTLLLYAYAMIYFSILLMSVGVVFSLGLLNSAVKTSCTSLLVDIHTYIHMCFYCFYSWEWKFGVRGVAASHFLHFPDFIIRKTEVKDGLAQDTD